MLQNRKVAGSSSDELLRFEGVLMTYKTGFGLDDWICCALYICTHFGTKAVTAPSLFTRFTVHSCARTRVLSLH
jgi:hypothetical protein